MEDFIRHEDKSLEELQEELSGEEVGKMVQTAGKVMENRYGTAQAIARSFYENNNSKYQENIERLSLISLAEAEKDNYDSWMYKVFEAPISDEEERYLQIRYGGYKDVFLKEEGDELVLAPNNENNFLDRQDQRDAWYDNIQNGRKSGLQFPAEKYEKEILRIDGELHPVLVTEFNENLIPWPDLDSKDQEKLNKDREAVINKLEELIDEGKFQTVGIKDFKKGNIAYDTEMDSIVVTDIGELPKESSPQYSNGL